MVSIPQQLTSYVVGVFRRDSPPPRAAWPGRAADVAMYLVIFMFGIFYFSCYMRATDLTLDATYPELARSLVDKGAYELDFLPETNFPPGFPIILALVCRWAGFSPAVLFHVVAVFATLGLLAAYEFLRRVEGRVLAAGACVLLASSPALFSFVTELVFAEMPYFFFSMMALLLALKLDRTRARKGQIGWMLGFALCLVLAVTIRSVGMALLAGLGTWILVAFLAKPNLARRRLALFCGPLILGLGAQALWTGWAGRQQAPEWSAGTWQQSYVAQLFMKDGDRPELGVATWRDIPGRIEKNLYNRAAVFSEQLTRRGGAGFWPSPLIAGVIVLIIVGLGASLRKDGGQLHDWYFLWHEVMFLLWPWDTEGRFVLPIFALACLYLWRGGRTLKNFAATRPDAAGVGFVLIGGFLAWECAEFALHVEAKRWQPILACLFWSVLAVIGLVIAGRRRFRQPRGINRFLAPLRWVTPARLTLSARAVAAVVFAATVVYGCDMQLRLARQNTNPDVTEEPWYADIEAAQWIRSHEPRDLVIMARKQDLVFHYTQQRVVFFPPISDPKILMDGIRRHHVSLIVVNVRKTALLEPPEDVCFQALLEAYPLSFHLAYSSPDSRIYELAAGARSGSD